jgi:nucleotide-binding universal stress UspA family protein
MWADELARVARDTHADALVVEAHDGRPSLFGKSLVARISKSAPCSVLTVPQPPRHFVTTCDVMPRPSDNELGRD